MDGDNDVEVEKTFDLETVNEICEGPDTRWVDSPPEKLLPSDPRDREYYFAKREGDILGCLYLKTILMGKVGTLGNVCVKKEFRGQGVGEGFINDILSKLRRKGCRLVVIGVYCENEPGLDFWRNKIGFRTLIPSVNPEGIITKIIMTTGYLGPQPGDRFKLMWKII